ncbi:MAG: DUF4065 domain-containing protein [Candidatus Pacebacteria bacterium]|nr:DUF4065 domain-containing protein [Candidatus Paceibacterota bacterium]
MTVKKELYCPKCNDTKKVDFIEKHEAYNVRGDKISTKAKVYFCKKCKNSIFDETIDDQNLEKAFCIYRKNHKLLSPDDIKAIRNKYGLSQRALCRLLEWGEITLCRYENGAIQDPVHNDLLEFIDEPRNMMREFTKRKHLLSALERNKLSKKLEKLVNVKSEKTFIDLYEGFLMSNKEVNEYTGYRRFDLEKMKNMILFFAHKETVVLKTKINKLLWYVDSLYFKTFALSMSGSQYYHLPYGPVPDNYDDIITLMLREKLIDKKEVVFDARKGIVGEGFFALKPLNKKYFTKDESKTMDFVLGSFKKYSCGQISDKSHKETAYKETEQNEKISYLLAQELSLSIEV